MKMHCNNHGYVYKQVHGRDTGVVVKTCCMIKSPVFVMGVRVFDNSFTTLNNQRISFL